MKIKNQIIVIISNIIFSFCCLNIFKHFYENYAISYLIAYCGGGLAFSISTLIYYKIDMLYEKYNHFKEMKKYTNPKYFLWNDNKTDDILYKNGTIVLVAKGRSKAAQKFVEALSYKAGYFCDFRQSAGYIYILCSPNIDAVNAVIKAIYDKDWAKQFIVPYSKESYDNETYFDFDIENKNIGD